MKRFSAVNATVEVIPLPLDISQNVLEETITSLNNDTSIHGIILFRPLPKHLSPEPLKNIISSEKDVDFFQWVCQSQEDENSKERFHTYYTT